MQKITRTLPTVARVFLGLVFLVFGANGFLHFLPEPSHSGASAAFLGALAAAGYMFPLVKATEIVTGALLLANVAVPFALVVLAPVVVNIAAFHLALAPEGLGVVAAILAAGLTVAHAHRAAFAPLFRPALAAKAAPTAETRPLRAAA
jgi:hypothetical protein